ncbi:DUF3727 domain-containing protein [Oscillatoria salina]|uniref:DUF3727 domain-containing protein n=1 Tax=Oscillatoria salina TaxID=331517 RepID=UPI0029623FBB|nr:DUF3727 domain-containing protein [Oscillatoria salina]
MFMPVSRFDDENEDSNTEIVTLTDETGRSLNCYVERTLDIQGSTYVLLLPVDSPVVIIAWDDEDEDEASGATLIEDDEEIAQIFDDAKAVLAEQNLTLKLTGFTLTVAGDLPEPEEDDLLTVELEEDDGEVKSEEFQFLTGFYHLESEYEIYTPLTPLLFFAQPKAGGKLELLSPEEFQRVQPSLEELLFDELD